MCERFGEGVREEGREEEEGGEDRIKTSGRVMIRRELIRLIGRGVP